MILMQHFGWGEKFKRWMPKEERKEVSHHHMINDIKNAIIQIF